MKKIVALEGGRREVREVEVVEVVEVVKAEERGGGRSTHHSASTAFISSKSNSPRRIKNRVPIALTKR